VSTVDSVDDVVQMALANQQAPSLRHSNSPHYHGHCRLLVRCRREVNAAYLQSPSSPEDPKLRLIKRLIALPGDWVTAPGTYEILQVPKGHCWVEGDNSALSFDSKAFGAVPLALLEGRVTYVLWPPTRIHSVDRQMPLGRVLSQRT